ncbi:uncharacterized protein [Haliotis asinina]|uniref:uncharacterized protein n=1 Tax=Haliotis asinina TaxID=109174 RepID=UPI0035327DC7
MHRVMLVTLLLACLPDVSLGNGLLDDPPMRSTLWRKGYNAPINYNDHTLNCGGFYRQHEVNDGKCGVCGDPWDSQRDNEAGGRFAKEIIITRHYTSGSDVKMVVEMFAPRWGYFELRLCPVTDSTLPVTQECLDQHPLEIVNGVGTRYPVEGEQREHHGKYELIVRLPAEVTCTHCVIQWKYHAGNEWGHDAKGRMCRGCGPQFEMYNCADVAIRPGDGQLGVGTATLRGGDTLGPAPGTRGPGPTDPVQTEAAHTGLDAQLPASTNDGRKIIEDTRSPSSLYPHPTEAGIMGPSGPHGQPTSSAQGPSSNDLHSGPASGISDPQYPTKDSPLPGFVRTNHDASEQTNYVPPTSPTSSETGHSVPQPVIPTIATRGSDMSDGTETGGVLKTGTLFNDNNGKFDQIVNDHGNGVPVSSTPDENFGFGNPIPTFLPAGTNRQDTPKPDESVDHSNGFGTPTSTQAGVFPNNKQNSNGMPDSTHTTPEQVFDDLKPTNIPVQTTNNEVLTEGPVMSNLKSELPAPSEKPNINSGDRTDSAVVHRAPFESTPPKDQFNRNEAPRPDGTDNDGSEPDIPTLGAKPFTHVNDEHHVSTIENNSASMRSSPVRDQLSSSSSSNSEKGSTKVSVKSSTTSSASGGWGIGTGWNMGDLSQLQIAPMLLLANKVWGGHGVMTPSLVGGWGGMNKPNWGGNMWGRYAGVWPGSSWGTTHGVPGAAGSAWAGAGNTWGGANLFTGNKPGTSWTGAGGTWPLNYNSWMSGNSKNQWGGSFNSWNGQPTWQASQRSPMAAHLPLCEASQRLVCEGLGTWANSQEARQFCNRNCQTGAQCPRNICACRCAYQYSLQCRYMTSGIALPSNHNWCNNVCNSGNCPVGHCDCKTVSNW